MSDFERRRDAVLCAETRADLARRLFEVRRHEFARKTKRWVGPVALLSGLLVGWGIGRPSTNGPSARYDHTVNHGPANSSPMRRVKPSTLGLMTLFLSGMRAVPFVLPFALTWLDKRHAERSAQAGAPIAVPTWMVALRGISSLLRR